jgi:hypothetical protein
MGPSRHVDPQESLARASDDEVCAHAEKLAELEMKQRERNAVHYAKSQRAFERGVYPDRWAACGPTEISRADPSLWLTSTSPVGCLWSSSSLGS